MQLSNQASFDLESEQNISAMAADTAVTKVSQEWIDTTGQYRYVYNWKWLGLPIIQLPADIVATQEIIWSVNPTVIIETGVARGGSIVFNASQLAMLDLCEGTSASLQASNRRCIGIDIDIRAHNREALEAHPLAPLVTLYEGSSIDIKTVDLVRNLLRPDDRVMVILDSNHTHEHVLRELELYSGLVTPGSFLVVHDTGIENAPDDAFTNRDWGKGDNPLTAMYAFLKDNKEFEIAETICNKLLITSSPKGYLRRVS
jgi:cephalosporin hydroxylase